MISVETEVVVSFADVDLYLIHWSAYPQLADRASSRVLAEGLGIDANWLANGNHVSISDFECSFVRPLTFGEHVRLSTRLTAAQGNHAEISHTFSKIRNGRLCASVTTRYHAEDALTGRPIPIPGARQGEPERERPAAPKAEITSLRMDQPSVTFERRVHLRQVDTVAMHWLTLIEWMDEGVCTLLASVGHPIRRLHSDDKLGFPLIGASGKIYKRLMLDEAAHVTTSVAHVGRTSLVLKHEFASSSGARIGTALTRHVCVERDTFQATSVPDWLRSVNG